VLAWLYLLAAVAGWALVLVADRWWLGTIFLLAPRWLLTLPVLVLLPLAAWRRRCSLPVVVAAGAIMLLPVSGFSVPWGHLFHASPQGTRLRVLSCNLHYFRDDAPALDDLIATVRPDIVAVQEWNEYARSRVMTGKDWFVVRTPHTFLASRWPIRRWEVLGPDSEVRTGAVLRCDIDTYAGLVHFFDLHLVSPRQGVYGAVREGQGIDRLEDENNLRREQSQWIADQASLVVDPVILAGDFNTPPESVLCSQYWGRYRDAFGEAGWGWGYTFHGGRTSVRIDHIFVGPGWHVERSWVGPDVGSPHRPVIADLVWTEPPS
jgi:endonuclease/exonuclease/phosphatase (EEP) superfamily protein YafD